VGQEAELYDYSTPEGRMELLNEAGHSPLEDRLAALLQRAVREELREPLPTRLYSAHKRGLADYLYTAEAAALKATERRRERFEREAEGPEGPIGTEPEVPIGGENESGPDDLTRLNARRRANRRWSKRRKQL
jgi:hypothetical protein